MTRILTLIVSALLVTAAHAAPASEASIDDLLGAMKAEHTLDVTFANLDQIMRQSMVAATQGQTLTEEQQRILDATPAKFAQVMREEMSWTKMHPLYVQIYQESFTQEDVDGLIAFYKSPAGVAYVEKMPVVLQKSMTIMQTRMGPLMARMKSAIAQAVEEAKAAKK